MKKILILAGGNDQCALIEEIRRYFCNDVEILLADMSANVKAISYADRFLQISTMDKESILEVARKENVDYVLTACGDQPLSTMAYVSKKLGKPTYLTETDIRDLTNKRYMKDKMIINNIPTSKHIYINKDWDGSMPIMKYPLVVKPVDSNGSKGVKKVDNSEDLMTFLAEAFRYSITGDVIIEEFKDGEELSVDIYVEGNVAKLLSITASKKIKCNKNSFTIVQSYYPAPISYSEDRVIEIAQKIVDSWHLHDTPLLIQMIVKDDEYNVLEFSARMGGGSKYHLIEVLSGVDIMKVYVEMVMGEKPHVEPHKMFNNAIMSYVYCRPGKFTALKGFDEQVANGIIHSYFTYRMPNSIITKADTSSDRVAGFLVVGDSLDEVNSKLAEANKNLQVLNEKNEDIMLHDIY